MNTDTYNALTPAQVEAFKRDLLHIDESIPTGTVVRDGHPMSVAEAASQAQYEAVMAAKRAEASRYEPTKRAGYTKPGAQPRDKAKAKAARAARKVNRQRGR